MLPQIVEEAIQEAGAKLIYLSPYSLLVLQKQCSKSLNKIFAIGLLIAVTVRE